MYCSQKCLTAFAYYLKSCDVKQLFTEVVEKLEGEQQWISGVWAANQRAQKALFTGLDYTKQKETPKNNKERLKNN